MQLVLLMHSHAKVKLKTEDLGLTSVNFHMLELVSTVFCTSGKLMSFISRVSYKNPKT